MIYTCLTAISSAKVKSTGLYITFIFIKEVQNVTYIAGMGRTAALLFELSCHMKSILKQFSYTGLLKLSMSLFNHQAIFMIYKYLLHYYIFYTLGGKQVFFNIDLRKLLYMMEGFLTIMKS